MDGGVRRPERTPRRARQGRATIAHIDCHYEGSRTYTGTRWHGLIRTWNACPGSHGSLTEAGLTAAAGNQQPQLYVQIRQAAGNAATTDHVLGSSTAAGDQRGTDEPEADPRETDERLGPRRITIPLPGPAGNPRFCSAVFACPSIGHW